MSMSEAFSYTLIYFLLYFNKILLLKSSKWSSLVSGSGSKSSPPEVMNPSIAQGLQQQPLGGGIGMGEYM